MVNVDEWNAALGEFKSAYDAAYNDHLINDEWDYNYGLYGFNGKAVTWGSPKALAAQAENLKRTEVPLEELIQDLPSAISNWDSASGATSKMLRARSFFTPERVAALDQYAMRNNMTAVDLAKQLHGYGDIYLERTALLDKT